MPAMSDAGAGRWRAVLLALGLVLALAAGMTLRLACPNDIEWKADERWTFNQARLMAAGGAWPHVGMPSSVGTPNPPLSVWVFGGLDWISGAKTPPALARAVQGLNVAALLALVLFAFAAVPRERREPWLWAAALWAVNPLAIIFERKIWPPSVLPLASVGLIAAWYCRRNAAAAFAWGLLGALMAQVHLGVAFFAAALVLWTLIHDRRLSAWKSWLAGSIVGALPAWSWFLLAFSHPDGSHAKIRLPLVHFFVRWITQPFGLGIEYTLGPRQMLDYLRGPLLAGHQTYLMAATHLVLTVAMLVIAVRAIRVVRANGWPGWRRIFLGSSAETLLVDATLWGYGGMIALLTVFGVDSHRHYMIFIAPMLALWAALAVMYGDDARGRAYARPILIVLCLAQAILSAGLLAYIDRVAIIHGEYGATWRAQQPGFVAPDR